jgi:hypothetical protein
MIHSLLVELQKSAAAHIMNENDKPTKNLKLRRACDLRGDIRFAVLYPVPLKYSSHAPPSSGAAQAVELFRGRRTPFASQSDFQTRVFRIEALCLGSWVQVLTESSEDWPGAVQQRCRIFFQSCRSERSGVASKESCCWTN